MYNTIQTHAGGKPLGIDILLTFLVGTSAAAALIIASGQPAKWLIFAVLCIFVFAATLIMPARERFFLFCTLFFCPYGSISILFIPKGYL